MYHQGDRIIWELCLKGDRNAFEALYRKYYPILYNYGKLYTQDADIVKNCLQDFFFETDFQLCQPITTYFHTCLFIESFPPHLVQQIKVGTGTPRHPDRLYRQCT